MGWKKTSIVLDDGTMVDAQAPLIVSVSRSTDIPAFYADWFFDRLNKGYSAWTNPFNGKKSYISYENTRFIVFWSKNPEPLIPYLDKLSEHSPKINCYIQYTLNDYVEEDLEKAVPNLDQRIKTFKTLVNKLGKGHVIWRFDPLILSDSITIVDLLNKIEYIGDRLLGYTDKLVFSFADIESYLKVKRNLIQNNVHYIDWTEEQMKYFSSKLSDLNKRKCWNYVLSTCCEKDIFQEFGIQPNSCIDENLIISIAWNDNVLMNFLGVDIHSKKIPISLFDDNDNIPEGALLLNDEEHYAVKHKNNKDKGQRSLCGCITSKDIGEYNTCPHQCEYCYANTSKHIAISNWKRHKMNPHSDSITGK